MKTKSNQIKLFINLFTFKKTQKKQNKLKKKASKTRNNPEQKIIKEQKRLKKTCQKKLDTIVALSINSENLLYFDTIVYPHTNRSPTFMTFFLEDEHP